MLDFDDNMLKLAKMHETLLKVDVDNRQENLIKYKNIVIEIDKQAFSGLLDVLRQINDHNQTLEDELQFLDIVSNHYKQLYELQLGFKNVCELYDDNGLQLSDLSQIDIDYINHRKNVIEGYLINLKNIKINKDKLEKLNDTLIQEEKNKMLLSKRLLDFEDVLRKNFINAEGRVVVDGKLQYISVISEYKELGYDFKLLLVDKDALKELLSIVSSERLEIDEKYKTAEICYNSNPSSSSKYILDDISKEFFKLRYRLTMLKILELLSNDYDSYEQFKEKREKILDLIKYRVVCLKNLGKHISIDPFIRTKIDDQLKVTSSFLDNSRKIREIIEETKKLSNLVDEMILQNDDYRDDLDETKDLIINTVSMGDMVSLVDIPESIYFEEQRVSDNQVISIKNVTDNFNMSIVIQKTNSVIKRVNQMMTSGVSSLPEKKIEIVSPELVIVNQVPSMLDDALSEEEQPFEVSTVDDLFNIPLFSEEGNNEERSEEEDVVELGFDDENNIENNNSYVVPSNYNSSIFETVDPFESIPLFENRTDEDSTLLEDDMNEQKIEHSDLEQVELEIQEDNNSDLEDETIKDEPDAFWVTQSDDDKLTDGSEEVVLSFDEQINALLSDEDNIKIKKLSA